MDQVEIKVRRVLIDEFGIDEQALQADNTLTGGLSMDSIELVQFALDIEEAFDMELPDSTFTASMTLGEVYESIRGLTSAV